MGLLSRAQSWLLTLYLGTAPVRWLPGLDHELVTRGKVILFALAVGTVFLATSPRRLRFPAGLVGPLGFGAIATLSIPGLLRSEEAGALAYLADLAYGAAMLWCFHNVARVTAVDAMEVLERSAAVAAAFASVAFLAAVAGIGWQAPCASAPFTLTGFGCGRTGWSQGIALYFPVLLVFLFRRDVGVLRRLLYAALGTGIIAAQLAVGGRAGLVASSVVISTMAFFFMPRRWKIMAATALCLLIAAFSLPNPWSEHLRLNRIPDDSVSLADVDRFSAGRVNGALEAIGYIAEKPFSGHGIGAVAVKYRGDPVEIHNLWLKWAAYLGIGAPALFLVISICLLDRARRLLRSTVPRRSVVAATGLTVVSGLVVSMLASGTPLGAFQDSAIWWAAAGLIVASAATGPGAEIHRRTIAWRSLVGRQPSVPAS